MSKDQDHKNIDTVLSSETVALTKMQNAIGELLETNKQLENSIELKQQVDQLKKEAPSLPWFKRLVQIIPQVKYLFIKNDEQIAAERREINKEILTYVDDTLKRIGGKSSSLQVVIDKELQAGLENVLHKSLSEDQIKKAGELQARLDSLNVSQESFREIVPKVYNAKEAAALVRERTQLTQIQQDMTKLVDANTKVQGLLAIKQELADLRQELPSTWLESLKQVVAKIKHVFVSTPEEILKDTVVKNNVTLRHVDNALKTTGRIIESSVAARKDNLQKELESLGKRKLSEVQSAQLKDLSSKLESTFAKAVTASESLLTRNQGQDQSQALYSSTPNLQTTPLRSAPPPPPLNASLPNLAVQQQQEVTMPIPQAPPLPQGGLQGTQQITTGSIPLQPKRHAPDIPRTRTMSLSDINAQQPAESARRASMSLQPTRQAPLPPIRTTSLPNQEVQQPTKTTVPIAPPLPPGSHAIQQPDVAPVIPPAPPPPPPVVPGLQHGVHQVEGQVIPPPPPLPQDNQQQVTGTKGNQGGIQEEQPRDFREELKAVSQSKLKKTEGTIVNDLDALAASYNPISQNSFQRRLSMGDPVEDTREFIEGLNQKTLENFIKYTNAPDVTDADSLIDFLSTKTNNPDLQKRQYAVFTKIEQMEKEQNIQEQETILPQANIPPPPAAPPAQPQQQPTNQTPDRGNMLSAIKDFKPGNLKKTGNQYAQDQTKKTEEKTKKLEGAFAKISKMIPSPTVQVDSIKPDPDLDDWGDNNDDKQKKSTHSKPAVDAPKGELPTSLVAKAQAIGETIPKNDNVAGQTKPPPVPPLPPKTRPVGQVK